MSDELKHPEQIKMKQYRNLLIVGIVAACIAFTVYYFWDTNEPPKKPEDTISFSSVDQHVSSESIWREHAQIKIKEQQQKTEELKNEIAQMKKSDTDKSIDKDPKFQALQKQNEMLEEAFKNINEEKGNVGRLEGKATSQQGRIFSREVGAQVNAPENPSEKTVEEMPIGIDNAELNLESTSKVPSKNKDTYVPAGAFAEAIMLGAADASAGVQASSNPSPMLFRIIANGTLPNHQKSHLKNCVVTAAVVGDISSERGLIRLERMSCTFPNGEIVEQAVEGTIYGKDGKNGVRGNPVWREGALLNRAAIAGTLSGLGSGLSQKYTTTSISPLGSTQTINNSDIMKFAGAQGVSNAMEKLADYNIRRAEQYHPTIQITAGDYADVVFLCGFFLDGRRHEPCGKANEKEEGSAGALFAPPQHSTNNLYSSENTSSGSATTPTGLTLSAKDVMKLKAHQRDLN